MTPKVSIIIPVYNGSNYLKEAIDSALAQTYKNIEIIVVNDGSSDNGATEKIAKSYGDKIRYFAKENGGVATALNLGIGKMTGEYFSWLSHDDLYYPDKIKKQIKYLGKFKNKNVILYSNYDVINEHGKILYDCKFNHKMLSRKPIYALLRGKVNGITMLVPKKAFDDYGGFDANLRCTQDYDLWYAMIKTYPFVHMAKKLTATRVHSMQDTQANPRAVIEGDVLWAKMVEKLSDEEKINAEGDLISFYLEMIKFLKDSTPYEGALAYCESALEEQVRNIKLNSLGEISLSNIAKIYDEFIFEGNQKKAASFYLANILKELVATGSTELASSVIQSKLIGNDTGLTSKDIAEYYIPKILTKSNKPRLLFCSAHWLTGGMERVMSILFTQLKDEYDLFLLTAYDGRSGKIEVPNYVNHIKIDNGLFYNSYDVTALSHILLLDIDVIIGFTNLINGQLDLYKLCADVGVKTIASNHEIYFYPYMNPYFYGLIQKRLDIYKRVDAALWLTNFSAAAYGLVNANSYLMPNPNTYKIQERAYGEKGKIILCVGRFNDYVKRVDRMLECFSIVLKTHPDARMVLVGKYDKDATVLPNDSTTMGAMIKKLNIDESKISFVGEVENVDKYYAEASVLLVTSMNEGFGMVINEAACFGVPTVANYIPGLEDLIVDGKNGYLVEQGNIDQMANVVDNILSDKSLRKELSANALSMASRFDRVEIGKRWKYLLNILLDSSNVKREKLNKKLTYKVDNYSTLSKILFDEMNKVIAVNISDIKQVPGPIYIRVLSKLSKKVTTAKRLIARKGMRGVIEVIMEKTSIGARKILRQR